MPISKLSRRQTRSYGEVSKVSRVPESRRSRRGLLDLPLRLYLKIVVVGVGVCFMVGTVVALWVSRELPDPNKLTNRQIAESTKIYDHTGQHLLYEVYQNQKRTVVELDQISPWVPKATIAVEDKHFYEHKGIRIVSIFRAGFNNLIGRREGGGGGSTLTQQLIKNALVGNERTLYRKVKEALLAIRLERAYSKDQILKLYLNEIPYGSTNYGIESAAQSYFHKSAKDLTLPEAAILAALPKAPSRYLNNPTALKTRRDTVLRLMFEQGYITEDEKDAAQNATTTPDTKAGIFDAPHFVEYVKRLLTDQFGDQLVDTGGLKVITTLDYDKQKLAEKIVRENGDKFVKESNANNAALVAIDPHTAQILAMVGSRDYTNRDIGGTFNEVVDDRRQPGSSFKPFVYTAAFEKGYTPDTVLYDVKTDFDLRSGNDTYIPKNYDGKEHGLVTMRKALQGSLNIPAVKTMYLVGAKETVEFAKRFGYTTFTGEPDLTIVLGGHEVSMMEHANAYATLANGGVYHAPVSILSVTSPQGEKLFEWQPNDGTEAVKPELAALTTSVLTDNQARAFIFGLSNNLVLPDRLVAAKTGTTNNNVDAWTLGYVPSLAVGVWVGNTPKHTPMKAGGNKLAGVIWNQFMRAALQAVPPEDFLAPPLNDAEKPVLRGADDGIVLPINKLTGKIAPSTTPENLIERRTYLPPHDILHYVNKDDPRGPIPDHPESDPQYLNWEQALHDWVQRQQDAGVTVTLEEPLTEYDALQSPELVPTVEIISPAASSTLTSRQIDIQVKATAPRGVSQVLYYLDGLSIGAATQYPFTLSYVAEKLRPGIHTLRVVAQDDLGTSGSSDVQFVLQTDPLPPDFDWTDVNPLTLTAVDFPRVFALSPWRWDDTKDIQIYLKMANGEKAIYNFNHAEDKLQNNQLLFTWKHSPGVGNYTLRGVLTDKDGKTSEKKLEAVVK